MVYRTRSNRGRTLALKRMAVNNESDLHLARQEIAITVSHMPHTTRKMQCIVGGAWALSIIASYIEEIDIANGNM